MKLENISNETKGTILDLIFRSIKNNGAETIIDLPEIHISDLLQICKEDDFTVELYEDCSGQLVFSEFHDIGNIERHIILSIDRIEGIEKTKEDDEDPVIDYDEFTIQEMLEDLMESYGYNLEEQNIMVSKTLYYPGYQAVFDDGFYFFSGEGRTPLEVYKSFEESIKAEFPDSVLDIQERLYELVNSYTKNPGELMVSKIKSTYEADYEYDLGNETATESFTVFGMTEEELTENFKLELERIYNE